MTWAGRGDAEPYPSHPLPCMSYVEFNISSPPQRCATSPSGWGSTRACMASFGRRDGQSMGVMPSQGAQSERENGAGGFVCPRRGVGGGAGLCCGANAVDARVPVQTFG